MTTGEPEFEVIELTRQEFEEGKRRALERYGITFEELEQMHREGNFTPCILGSLWVMIGGGYGE